MLSILFILLFGLQQQQGDLAALEGWDRDNFDRQVEVILDYRKSKIFQREAKQYIFRRLSNAIGENTL